MNAAPRSSRVVMKRIDEEVIASITWRFSSPGRPKTYSTPSFSRHETRSCATLPDRSVLTAPAYGCEGSDDLAGPDAKVRLRDRSARAPGHLVGAALGGRAVVAGLSASAPRVLRGRGCDGSGHRLRDEGVLRPWLAWDQHRAAPGVRRGAPERPHPRRRRGNRRGRREGVRPAASHRDR